jgi:cytosine/adenosine deaminase-related metal-dependent hydrolase
VEANQTLRAGFHIHVAEDACDSGSVRRLRNLGVLSEKTLAAHCIHITAADRKALAELQVNVIHNPQSNCNNAVGTANLPELFRKGVMVGLGSDGYTPRMWDEFKTAFHAQKLRSADPRVAYAEAYAAAFLNNRTIVNKLFGLHIGRIESGAKADLILVDYFPPTPIDSGNLFGHILFGIANAPIDSLMVNGRWVVRDKQCVNVDERSVAEKAAVQARSLWERF